MGENVGTFHPYTVEASRRIEDHAERLSRILTGIPFECFESFELRENITFVAQFTLPVGIGLIELQFTDNFQIGIDSYPEDRTFLTG